MEFGKLAHIENVDFTLPKEDAHNQRVLQQQAVGDFTFCFGSARWGEKDLIGKIYPPKTAAKDFLHYYAKAFMTIEMNTTHYRIPTVSMVEDWCERAGTHFKFCPKVPQTISHSRDFGHSLYATDQFLEALYAFGPQLGMPFMQLPPDFSPQEGKALFAYLRDWPKDLPLALEFRHPDWFAHERIRNRAFELLEEIGISTVITDTAGRRDVVHQRLTNGKVFVRFVGNRLHPTDYTRLDAWVQQVRAWQQQGIHEIFFIVHQPEEHYCVDLTIYLVEQINRACQLSLISPRLLPIGEQQSLF